MKSTRKIIEIDQERCNGCGLCVPACAEGAMKIVDGKARVIADRFCDGLGACLGECPRNALRIVERQADEFDAVAVEEHLEKLKNSGQETLASGCPSARMESFSENTSARTGPPQTAQPTALTHWPVQIRLVPPHAPFLKNADLLIMSDCTPVAYPDFHRDFIQGRTVLMGCPKFDDRAVYTQKFAEIFSQAEIASVTVVVMEVPCCHGMPVMVREGMQQAGKKVPMEVVTISVKGDVINRQQHAA